MPAIIPGHLAVVPFVISSRVLEDAVRGGPQAVEAFLKLHVGEIERLWKRGARVETVLLASASLRRGLSLPLPATEAGIRLTIVEADATLAAARHSADADRAFDLAEQAQSEISRASLSDDSRLQLLSEAMLIGSVALKAVGMPDESIAYLRGQIRERSLDPVEAVSLSRQEVMMFQSERRHLMLLNSVSEYQASRPLEYFRTLKRVLEFLLATGRLRAARDLAPETGRAFARAVPELSALGYVSFMKNVAQVLGSQGESYRALRLLYLCDRLAEAAGFIGQQRQVKSLMAALDADEALVMPTFSLSP